MGVKTAQQILDAERLAPDMLDVPFVVLMDGLRNEIYQFRRLAAEFLQVNVKGVVGRFTSLPSWMKSFISMFSNNGSSAYFTLNV